MNGSGRDGMAVVRFARLRALVPAVAALIATLLAIAPVGAAAGTIVLPRPGQVGVAVQGGFGTLLKSGDLGGVFGNGPTVAARLRYRLRYERALGLTFENQRFEIRTPEALFEGLPGRTRVNMVLSGLEFYQMFGTRTPTTTMLIFGAGIVQTSGRFLNGETFYPGDGTFLSAGFGVERFVYRSWALDLSTRYMRVFIPDDHADDVQVSLGLIFYASY